MASLDRNLSRDLENAVKKARRVAEAGTRQSIEQLAVSHHEPWSALTPEQRRLRNRLRAHGRQLGDRLDERKGTQTIERLAAECAYEHWHRLLFARFLAENDLLVEPVSGMALSLDECREIGRERGIDWLVLASDFAQRMLPQIFRAGDPVLEVALPPEKRQELEAILEGLPRDVFVADDSLGWVYQFWQSEQKDAINASESKIGADELPAVTQLFTEDYMVLFLLHNTLGAWWAGKVLAASPGLALSASSEDECRAGCAVAGVEWTYLRFVREDEGWRPAAGTFSEWPRTAKDITVLDPCMGSGHFLAFALPMLVALRRAEENLSIVEAVDGVLRDNLFGLELDPRCTQIAAFNVGLSAWKLAGYRPLPPLNLACAGLGINAPLAAWTALAAGDALAENAMKQLYELFRQAPTLGSLIDPTRVGGELFVANFDKIRALLSSALASEQSEDAELAVVAQGIARAAQLLAKRYSLVATNVPYLGRGKQSADLQRFCESTYPASQADLAAVFVERCLRYLQEGGATAIVTKDEWFALVSYETLRKALLASTTVDSLCRLGARAFDGISGERVSAGLIVLSRRRPADEHRVAGIDASSSRPITAKAEALHSGALILISQSALRAQPGAAITLDPIDSRRTLARYATCYQGTSTGDAERLVLGFWELPADPSWVSDDGEWRPFQGPPDRTRPWGGRESIVRMGVLSRGFDSAAIRGREAWGKRGIAIGQVSALPATLYSGEFFADSTPVIVPRDDEDLGAIWAFCSSPAFNKELRRLNPKLSVNNGYVSKIEFDRDRWRHAFSEAFPQALPSASVERDPSQWIFSGHPGRCSHALHVAVARLIGYRWPRQVGLSFADCPALKPDGLESHADEDGIVCLPSLRGEASATERLRALLADAFGATWSAQRLNDLLAAEEFDGKSLDDWLRDGFFEQHCALFHHRPFVWQVWDGRKDGFSALVNYHRLAAPNGEGRRALDKLTHTYLGDWLDRQRADQKAGVEGADGRVAAAEHLKRELEKILEGDPPCDIFVRWKPLCEQPIGWEPDIEDGVRANIRPFMAAKPLNARGKNACILRVTPKLKWDKDRGKEPSREKAHFPWFWGWDGQTQDFHGDVAFDGNRWNDLHYSRAVKLAARERAKGGKS